MPQPQQVSGIPDRGSYSGCCRPCLGCSGSSSVSGWGVHGRSCYPKDSRHSTTSTIWCRKLVKGVYFTSGARSLIPESTGRFWLCKRDLVDSRNQRLATNLNCTGLSNPHYLSRGSRRSVRPVGIRHSPDRRQVGAIWSPSDQHAHVPVRRVLRPVEHAHAPDPRVLRR